MRWSVKQLGIPVDVVDTLLSHEVDIVGGLLPAWRPVLYTRL